MISFFKALKVKETQYVDGHQLRVLHSYMVCKNGFIHLFIHSFNYLLTVHYLLKVQSPGDILVNRTIVYLLLRCSCSTGEGEESDKLK